MENIKFMQNMNNQFQGLTNIYNNSPVKEFENLAPVDMHRLLQEPINTNNAICKLNINIENNELDEACFFQDIRRYLFILQELQPIKLTSTGALPSSICKSLANMKMLEGDNWWYAKQKQTIVRESNFYYLGLLNSLPTLFGLTKKVNNKLSLTKKGINLLADQKLINLYIAILEKYFVKFNWGFSDGYSEASIIQAGSLFSIYLVQKYGGVSRNVEFYSSKFLKAFPTTIDEFTQNTYSTPEAIMKRCYSLRVFSRFLLRFGLIKPESVDSTEIKLLTKTSLIEKLFIWTDSNWVKI